MDVCLLHYVDAAYSFEKLTQNQNQNSSVPSVKRVYSNRLLCSILIRARDNWYFTDSGDCA